MLALKCRFKLYDININFHKYSISYVIEKEKYFYNAVLSNKCVHGIQILLFLEW